MQDNEKSEEARNHYLHEDPISGEQGSHPIGTAVGTAIGGAFAGVAAGVVGGPVGATFGAFAGGIAGAFLGKEIAERIDPTFETAYWKAEYPNRAYFQEAIRYSDISPAYRYGWEARMEGKYPRWEDAEMDARARWFGEENADLAWESVRPAFRDAWDRAGRKFGREII